MSRPTTRTGPINDDVIALRAELRDARVLLERLASALELAVRLRVLPTPSERERPRAAPKLTPDTRRHLTAILPALYRLRGSGTFLLGEAWSDLETHAGGDLRAALAGLNRRRLGILLGLAARVTDRIGIADSTLLYAVHKIGQVHRTRRWQVRQIQAAAE